MTTGYSWAAVNPAGVVAVLTMNPGKRPPAGLVTTIHPPLPWRLTNFSFPTIVPDDLILTKNLEIPDINFCCVAVREECIWMRRVVVPARRGPAEGRR